MLKRFAIVLSVALAATAACSKSDTGIKTAVKTKLAVDDTVKSNDIAVDAGKQVVTLNGTVASADEKDRAATIARDTKGVNGVVDDIVVNPNAAATSGEGDQKTDTAKSDAHEAKVKTENTAHQAKVKTEAAADKTGEVIADSAITSDIKTKFLAEPGVSGLDIHVETTKGVVTLSGNVKSKAEADKALSIAHGTHGVKRVMNHMKVAAG